MGKRPNIAAVGIHAKEHERLWPPTEKPGTAARADECQAPVRQRTREVVVKRPLGELYRIAPVGVHPIQMIILVPGALIAEVDLAGTEIGCRVADYAVPRVKKGRYGPPPDPPAASRITL